MFVFLRAMIRNGLRQSQIGRDLGLMENSLQYWLKLRYNILEHWTLRLDKQERR